MKGHHWLLALLSIGLLLVTATPAWADGIIIPEPPWPPGPPRNPSGSPSAIIGSPSP